MLNSANPFHISILQPSDLWPIQQAPPQEALMISAVCGSNPRLAPLAQAARQCASTLFVDPKTPYLQFEGYMSMPDYRALPYSPGRAALGTLWQPARFAREEARGDIIRSVVDTQIGLGADIVLAPYFYIPHHEHPWLRVSRDCALETIAAQPAKPVGVAVCVDIDAMIDDHHRATIAATYRDIPAAVFLVTVVNYDERRADPRDARTLLAFLAELQSTGVPVVLAYAGRTGLAAVASGAAGYASGAHGLEHHPRSFYREMMGTRAANSYYLHECYFALGGRRAQACLELDAARAHDACRCTACDGTTAVSQMVSRRLALHALLRRRMEMDDLKSVAPGQRRAHLVERFSAALRRAPELSAALTENGHQPIADGEFHYLEILREALGGPAATIPLEEPD